MPYLYHVDINSTQNAELMRYCKMENVPLAVLLHVDEPRNATKFRLRIRLKSMVLHLLKRVDKRLNAMIGRLSADTEYKRMIRRQL